MSAHTKLDALLSRVHEVNHNAASPHRNEVAYDCLRMFEDLATRFKEESAARDRYKVRAEAWRGKAFDMADLLSALRKAEAFISDELETREHSWLPDPTLPESKYIESARSALNAVRAAIAKAEGRI